MSYAKLQQQQQHLRHVVQVYTKSLARVDGIKAIAVAPDGRSIDLTVAHPDDDIYYISFLPTLKGTEHNRK